jgi:hypothetical protein
MSTAPIRRLPRNGALPISPDAGKTEATPEQIADWIDRHFAKPMLLPCRVDEMTEREAEIFKVAAYHIGFIQFLRTTLPTIKSNS